MKIRIEVPKARSSYWPKFLAQAVKVPGYHVAEGPDGKDLHVMTFNTWDEMERFFGLNKTPIYVGRIFGWAGTRVYINDLPVAMDDVWSLYWRSKGMTSSGTPIQPDDPNDDAPSTTRMLEKASQPLNETHHDAYLRELFDREVWGRLRGRPLPPDDFINLTIKIAKTPCPECGHPLAPRCPTCGRPAPDPED